MTSEMGTVKAEFDGRGFVIRERSSNVKEPPSVDFPLLTYLNILSQTGWLAVRGRFDGWTIVLDLERKTETPEKISTYMMVMLYQFLDPEGLLSAAADSQAKLVNELQGVRVKEGWETIAGPKHFARRNELWTISIWVKNPTI